MKLNSITDNISELVQKTRAITAECGEPIIEIEPDAQQSSGGRFDIIPTEQ